MKEVVNGVIEYTADGATLTCDRCYKPDDESRKELTCNNGNWNTRMAACVCEYIKPIYSLTVTYVQFTSNLPVTYLLITIGRISVSKCGEPGVPANGYTNDREYNCDDRVSYICDAGYTLRVMPS